MLDDDDPPEWEAWMAGPEAQMHGAEARWQPYCHATIDRLWKDLPILGSPLIWVSPRWMQVKYQLRRWH